MYLFSSYPKVGKNKFTNVTDYQQGPTVGEKQGTLLPLRPCSIAAHGTVPTFFVRKISFIATRYAM